MDNPVLTLELPTGPIKFSVRFDRWDGAKPQFWYRVESDGNSFEGADLRLGASTDPSLAEGMRALVDFFAAYADGCEYEHRNPGSESENGSLFGPDLKDAAYAIGADTVSMLAREIHWKEDD